MGVPFVRLLACSDYGGGEGVREPRRSAAAVSRTGRGRAGADHVEVEVVFVCSFDRAAVVIVVVVGDRGEGDHCLPRRERSQGRAVGRARCVGRRKMLLPRLPPPPPLHRFESASSITVGTSFRHYCICRRRLLQQVQLSHNRRAPRKSRTRGGDELNGRNVMGRQAGRESGRRRRRDGKGRLFMRVSKLFGSQPR